MRILLVEDDHILGMAVRDQLIDDGHSADWVKRLDEAVDAIHAAAFELILLDLMLPDGRGLDFLKRLRSAGDVTPVMVLTALDQISDRIAALDVGADDYLIKPFDLFELSARIRAVGRRYSGNPNPLVAFGDFEVDLAARSVRRGGRLIQLTATEFFNGIRQFRSFPANWLVRAFREKPTFILHIGRTRRRSVQTNEVRKISKRLIPLPKVAL